MQRNAASFFSSFVINTVLRINILISVIPENDTMPMRPRMYRPLTFIMGSYVPNKMRLLEVTVLLVFNNITTVSVPFTVHLNSIAL